MKALKKVGLGMLFVLLTLGFSSKAFPNALQITGFTYNQVNKTVTFNLQWLNSWRLDGSAAPFNWDAAWVFVKFRPCGVSSTTPWTHGKVDTSSAFNNYGTLSPCTKTSASYFTDSAGVMLRRNATGFYGAAAPTTVTFRVANMPAAGTSIDIKVFGIEMVFVPQGAYSLGSVTNSNAFAATTSGVDVTPVNISSEAAVTLNAHNLFAPNATVNLPAAFPKGFGAFYIMKYEISEDQYAGFLNTISSLHQIARYPGSYGTSRNQLGATGAPPDIYVADRPDRAANYLGWDDVAAYLDWAALRPNSELEYEKACRGAAAVVANEYAWGSTTIVQLTNLTTPENGAEVSVFTTANCNYNFAFLTGGDGGSGPVRCGIFALPTSPTRDASGATYYGIMEMSGNVWEPLVRVGSETSTAGTLAFSGNLYGDGNLSATGAANTAGWPNAAASTNGYIQRGGSWSDGTNQLRVSDRSQFAWTGTRDDSNGGRGGR